MSHEAPSTVEVSDSPPDVAVEAGELIELLTDHESTFCLAYVETAGNPAKAYIQAYGHSRMPGARGLELLQDPRIRARIIELQGTLQEVALVSMQSHLGELAVIRDMAKEMGAMKVALEAEVKRGTVAGLYISKGESAPVDASPKLKEIEERLIGLNRKAKQIAHSEVTDVVSV